MNKKPILLFAIILSLLMEVILISAVFNILGGERLHYQLVRIGIQLILILWLAYGKSNIALFLLTAYHIFSAVMGFGKEDLSPLETGFFSFHLVLGFAMYFHEWIEERLVNSESLNSNEK